MKLEKLFNHGPKRNVIFLEYISRLKKLCEQESTLEQLAQQVLTEGKRVVVTTEIIDDDEEKKEQAKQQFIEQAQNIGKFDDSGWVKQVINGLKQAGVQGVNSIAESERPVTAGQVRQLIEALVQLISK